ncbi:unnamed protein product [Symbiodinium sp. KB8]|nr:unnamed protein product [Symbiodinium sp. KB8]
MGGGKQRSKKPLAEPSRGRSTEKKDKKEKKEKRQAPVKTAEESKSKRKAQSTDMQSGKQSKSEGDADAGPLNRLRCKTPPVVDASKDKEKAKRSAPAGALVKTDKKEKKEKADNKEKKEKADKKEKKEKSSKDTKDTAKPSSRASSQGKDSCAKNLLDSFELATPEERAKRAAEVEDMLNQMEDSESGSNQSSDDEDFAESAEEDDAVSAEEISSDGSEEEPSSEGDSDSSSDAGAEEAEGEGKIGASDARTTTTAAAIANAAQTAADVTVRNNRKKFPVSLSSHLQRDKVDLFNLWLDNNQDLQKVAIVVEREVENKNTSRAGFDSVKGRDLIKKYGETKGTKLVAALRNKGRWYWDPEFPQDEEEIYYYTSAPRSILNENSTANRMKLTGTEANPDSGLLSAMTGEQGPLNAGALPSMEADGSEGDKALAEALAGKVSKAKPPKKQRTESAEKVVPTSSKERAEAALQDILKDGGAARKLALGLQHVDYGDALKDQMFEFSKSMEVLYSSLQKLLLKKGHVKDKKFRPALEELEKKNAWLKKAEALPWFIIEYEGLTL